MDELDDRFFVSLCFGPSVSVRSWFLSNAFRFPIRPYVLLTVMLGFTKDPYPYVRRVALDGLVGLSKSSVIEDCGVIEGCYCRAVELLGDAEDSVRCAAVHAVSEWGKMLVASVQEMNKRYWSDAVFVRLCSMVRDMSMEVRVAAFDALGKIGVVSEDILLQTLSKRVLGITKEKKPLGQCSAKRKSLGQYIPKHFDIQACVAAGAFVHGLEDEFYEVRWSACHSLHTLTILSAKFAGEALNLLMDVLNDDSLNVRLRALETMHHMATCDHLKVQETHMHMFLGTLVDNSTFIRSTARKILRLMKLHDLKMFQSSIDGLLDNLEVYPQDEADILSVLFDIGRNHGNFVVCIIKKFSQEIEPSCEGRLDFDSVRVAALLVLAISAPLSEAQKVCSIPSRIFSYAVTLLGRISHALKDVMNQNTLLAYLSHCSKSTIVDNSESFFPMIEGDIPNCSCIDMISPAGMSLQQGASENENQKRLEPRKSATPLLDCQLEVHSEVAKSIKLILLKINDIWFLVQKGCMAEVLRMLRSFREELATYMSDSLVSADTLAFTFQYLRVVKLLAKVWEHFLPPRKTQSYRIGELNLLLGKLDRNLKEMRYRFRGLSKEEELHVLELILVTCILRLSKVEICCHNATLKKLSMIISHAEFLHKEGSIEPYNFVVELKKSLGEIDTYNDGASCRPFLLKRLLESFSLKQFRLSGSLKHIKAEIDLPGNDTEPLPFISGLPVGIPLEITLYNVSSENRLWLRMIGHEQLMEFVFLDLNQSGGCDEVRKFTFMAPFYRTPKAMSLTLRVCIGMECLFEDVNLITDCGGPTRELVYICQEKEVYLGMIAKT